MRGDRYRGFCRVVSDTPTSHRSAALSKSGSKLLSVHSLKKVVSAVYVSFCESSFTAYLLVSRDVASSLRITRVIEEINWEDVIPSIPSIAVTIARGTATYKSMFSPRRMSSQTCRISFTVT